MGDNGRGKVIEKYNIMGISLSVKLNRIRHKIWTLVNSPVKAD